MRKIIFIVLILIMIVLPTIVTAEIQSLPVQKRGTCINILQTCSNCTYVNIDSITYPNLTKSYINTAMTKEGYGYSILFCDTSLLGDYIATTCGNPDGIITCVNYNFPVTPNGEKPSVGMSITFGILALLIFLVMCILLYIGFTSQKVPLIIVGVYVGLLFVILLFQVFINNQDVITNLSMFNMVTTLYSYYLWIFYASLVVGVVLLIWLLTKWGDIKKKRQFEEWGLIDLEDG